MLRVKRGDLCKRFGKAVLRLSGDAVHKVNVYVPEARLSCKVIALPEAVEGMHPSEGLKLAVVRALKPDAQAVHPCAAELFELLICDGCRICLDCEFRVLAESKVIVYTVGHVKQTGDRHGGRCSAAEIHGVNVI